MAKRNTVARKKAAPRITKPSKPKAVGVSSDLREKYNWFDSLAEDVLAAEVEKSRREKRKDGLKLSAKRLESVLGQIERIQRELNPLEKRKERLVKRLVAHWGHTGERELTDALGNTLITISPSMGLVPEVIREKVGEEDWMKFVVTVLKPEHLLLQADVDEKIRAHIRSAIVVTQLKVQVTPPSSRRPRSAQSQG